MTVQYRESDLAFLKRLLAEEGLFCWFEHRTDTGETLGSHTLVIADRNDAFTTNPQARIRFTQAGATLAEDALDRWHGLRQLDTTDTHAASWDYRSLSSRPQSATSAIDSPLKTSAWHDPGQYAWQNSAHGERMLLNQRQAIDARLKQFDGQGTVPAWSQPRLQFAAPAGIAQLTPANNILAAGKNLVITTGQDTNLIAQGNHSLAVKDGLALFTIGKASDKNKPNQETGIHLHAASGSVSLQSQGGKTTAAADKKVTIASSTGQLTASAKQKILATAQGAYLKIEGGNIELHAPKKVEFKASKKDWTGPKMGSAESVNFPRSELVIDTQKTAKYPVSL